MSCIGLRELEPRIIREGIYGASFNKNGETLFLRMELLTEANARNWGQFQLMTLWVANASTRGLLGSLVDSAGTPECPQHDQIQEHTGFTQEEYSSFVDLAICQKAKTAGKIVRLLEKNSVGSGAMFTAYLPRELHYITYITKSSSHSIQYLEDRDRTLKNYINAYGDVLISMGSDFSKESTFHNRGISRNPYWVFKGKYSGLSMLLHGFTGAVAAKHFPQKLLMEVTPVGSMQCIIKKNLLPNEGHVKRGGIKIDITALECTEDAPEKETNYITVLALNRIYHASNSNIETTGMLFLRGQSRGCVYPL